MLVPAEAPPLTPLPLPLPLAIATTVADAKQAAEPTIPARWSLPATSLRIHLCLAPPAPRATSGGD